VGGRAGTSARPRPHAGGGADAGRTCRRAPAAAAARTSRSSRSSSSRTPHIEPTRCWELTAASAERRAWALADALLSGSAMPPRARCLQMPRSGRAPAGPDLLDELRACARPTRSRARSTRGESQANIKASLRMPPLRGRQADRRLAPDPARAARARDLPDRRSRARLTRWQRSGTSEDTQRSHNPRDRRLARSERSPLAEGPARRSGEVGPPDQRPAAAGRDYSAGAPRRHTGSA